jgi:4-carboxymuconolactone decarboxylase
MVSRASPPSVMGQVKDVFPKLGELTEKVVFGDIWERPGLAKRDRSLITLAALIALHRPEQRANAGSAAVVAKEVFAERNA